MPFETIDLGRIIQASQGLAEMKRQSRFDALQEQALRGNIAGQQQAQQFAAAQEQRAATQFTQEQQIANTRLLNAAAAEVAQNPAALQRWLPQLRQSGVLSPDFDPATVPPEQLQQLAGDLYQSTGAALAALNPQDGPSGPKISEVSPNQFEPASVAKFQQTGNYADLVPRYTPETVSIVPVAGGLYQFGNRSGIGPEVSPADQERTAAAAAAAAKAEASAKGAADAERAATAPQRAERARQVISTIDNTMGTINSALSNINATTVGIIGSGTRLIPGSKAFDLSEQLKTIRANIGFDRLQQMRDASPTGGALGQVAVQELEALQASIASLNQAQSAGQLRKGLLSVRKSYNNWKSAVERANRSERSGGWTVVEESN